jgi:hypothetical protein
MKEVDIKIQNVTAMLSTLNINLCVLRLTLSSFYDGSKRNSEREWLLDGQKVYR